MFMFKPAPPTRPCSGQAPEKRRRLDELMGVLQRGDRLVVSELSRLGRSLGQIATDHRDGDTGGRRRLRSDTPDFH